MRYVNVNVMQGLQQQQHVSHSRIVTVFFRAMMSAEMSKNQENISNYL